MLIKNFIVSLSLLTLISCYSAKQSTIQTKGKTSQTIRSSKEALMTLALVESQEYKYSVNDYMSRSKVGSFRFSPNGKYISYKKKDSDGKNHVYVEEMGSKKVYQTITEVENIIAGYAWANNDRLVYVMDKGGDENYHLFSVDLKGEQSLDLTPFPEIQVSIIESLKEQKDYFIINLNKDDPEVFEPYKINITNGHLENLYQNKNKEEIIDGYDFDKNAELKAITQQVDGTDYVLSYRTANNQPFKQIVKTSWKDTFGILEFNYATPYPHDAFVLTNLQSDKKKIVLYDFAENKVINEVFSHPVFDADSIKLSRQHQYEVGYYSYNGIKNEVVPVSMNYKKWYKSFNKKFENKEVEIVSVTDDEEKMLIIVSSDKLYGIYYVYDTENDSYIEMANLKPQLLEMDMADVQPIEYFSRDGLKIHGYLTMPKKIAKQRVPLIVNPHGGPYGERDSWGFDSQAQLFASRGYAVLQANYRGSGGYGKKFELAGSKQIGRKMLNDLEDGVAYVKTLGLIDEKRIAIYGGSYGGLATLGSLVKTPDLYACGVDYVGVSNLFTFFDSFPPYWRPYLKQVYAQWYDPNSKQDKVIMKQVSPALNVDKISKPLFVVQGANDPRVNINESNQIVQNLRNRGFDVPYMVKDNEGHGFNHENNRIELYQTMLGFFAKYLKNKTK